MGVEWVQYLDFGALDGHAAGFDAAQPLLPLQVALATRALAEHGDFVLLLRPAQRLAHQTSDLQLSLTHTQWLVTRSNQGSHRV